jgi:hypothetical protein
MPRGRKVSQSLRRAVFLYPLTETGGEFVECPEHIFVLVPNALIGVEYHLGGDEVLPSLALVEDIIEPYRLQIFQTNSNP